MNPHRRPTSDCRTLSTTGEDSLVRRTGCGGSAVFLLVGTSLSPLHPCPFREDCGAAFSEEERSNDSLCSMVRYQKVRTYECLYGYCASRDTNSYCIIEAELDFDSDLTGSKKAFAMLGAPNLSLDHASPTTT